MDTTYAICESLHINDDATYCRVCGEQFLTMATETEIRTKLEVQLVDAVAVLTFELTANPPTDDDDLNELLDVAGIGRWDHGATSLLGAEVDNDGTLLVSGWVGAVDELGNELVNITTDPLDLVGWKA